MSLYGVDLGTFKTTISRVVRSHTDIVSPFLHSLVYHFPHFISVLITS